MLLLFAGIIETLLGVYLFYRSIRDRRSSILNAIAAIKAEVGNRTALLDELEKLYQQLIDMGSVKKIIEEAKILQESVKAERGRITITQAELETVEARLREVEEIDRELEASGAETNNEVGVLKKKLEALQATNREIQTKVQNFETDYAKLSPAMKLTPEVVADITQMQDGLSGFMMTSAEVMDLVGKGNDHFLILKKRYDALDIEYAQLYEKFASEAPPPQSGGN